MKKTTAIVFLLMLNILVAGSCAHSAGFFEHGGGEGGGTYPTTPTFDSMNTHTSLHITAAYGNNTASLLGWRDAYINRNITGTGSGSITGYYAGSLKFTDGKTFDEIRAKLETLAGAQTTTQPGTPGLAIYAAGNDNTSRNRAVVPATLETRLDSFRVQVLEAKLNQLESKLNELIEARLETEAFYHWVNENVPGGNTFVEQKGICSTTGDCIITGLVKDKPLYLLFRGNQQTSYITARYKSGFYVMSYDVFIMGTSGTVPRSHTAVNIPNGTTVVVELTSVTNASLYAFQ